MIISGKMNDIMRLLREAIEAGYGNLPAVYALKFYLERN